MDRGDLHEVLAHPDPAAVAAPRTHRRNDGFRSLEVVPGG
jgi:hypothetical protein